jgi:hypothetical protein
MGMYLIGANFGDVYLTGVRLMDMYSRGSEVMSRGTNTPHQGFHSIDVKFDFLITT